MAGRYGSSTGLTSRFCTAKCPAGYVCPTGTATPSMCAAGKYSRYGVTCSVCGAGSYLTDGASACTKCPPATPYSLPGSTSVAACIGCIGGCPNASFAAQLCLDSSWYAVYDTNGVEGAHSCLKVTPEDFGIVPSPGTVAWNVANSTCNAMGSDVHLLVTRQVRCGRPNSGAGLGD